MSDREILIALFNVMGALAERVTGESFVLCHKDHEGNVIHSYPSTEFVTWFSDSVVAEGQSYSALSARHCRLHGVLYDKQQEPQPSVEQ